MPILITPESELGKEMAKWNKPYKYEPFPKMLYKAQRLPNGHVSVAETDDGIFGGQPGSAETFSTTCQMTVQDETELTRAIEMGWRDNPNGAMEFFEEKEKALAASAAHRAYEDRNMGEKATAEASAADAETAVHVAEVKRKKVRRRKRA